MSVDTDSPHLTEMTVNLVPQAVVALHTAAQRCGDNPTDTVNRALQMYEQITAAAVDARATGRLIVMEMVDGPDGAPVTITVS